MKNINITEEMICDAIYIAWGLAIKEKPGTSSHYNFWKTVDSELDGMFCLLNRAGANEKLLSDIDFLRQITITHRRSG